MQAGFPMRRICHFMAGVVAALFATVSALTADEPLMRIADVRSLPPAETEKGLPVHVRGVVTWCRGTEFTVQDMSGGIWVNVIAARKRDLWRGDDSALAALRPGHVVEIYGVTDRGGFSPPILPRSVTITGKQYLPPVRQMDPARFFSGLDDCQRLEVRGTVQGFRRVRGASALLIMDANPGGFVAEVPASAVPDPSALVDAEVRLQGVAISLFNTRGEFQRPYVFVSAADGVVIERPPVSQPFEAPIVPLHGIARFRAESMGPHRVMVRGTVTYSAPNVLFLQDEGMALRVETSTSQPVSVGDRVEASGFVDDVRTFRGLTEALIRKTGSGACPEPAQVTPEQVLEINRKAEMAGVVAQPDDFEGRLIAFEAVLANLQHTSSKGYELLLEKGRTWVKATLDEKDGGALDHLRIGSVLAVKGIVQLEYQPGLALGRAAAPAGIRLLLRGCDDLTVEHAPSWWTLRRVLIALVAVLVALGAAMSWAGLLQRRVAAQASQLAAEMRARRESAVEFDATLRERNRLAANLHDTLLQTMNGIGFQIDACERVAQRAGGASSEPLQVARRMVDHAVNELRGSVWELRGLPLKGSSLSKALSALAAHVAEGQSAAVTVRTDGPIDQVPEFVAGNVLLIVQEALNNALRHARPRSVEVHVSADDASKRLQVTVRDDGCGFDPAGAKGPAQGHFGFVGMKERAERLGGGLRIESTPGGGTTVYAEVALREFDRELS
jgi:signal transduction histidine kinase